MKIGDRVKQVRGRKDPFGYNRTRGVVTEVLEGGARIAVRFDGDDFTGGDFPSHRFKKEA